MEVSELELQSLRRRALIATSEEIEWHQISSRPQDVLGSPKALMSSKYLCRMVRPDSSLIVYKVLVWDQYKELQRIRALIDSGATSMFVSLQPCNGHGLPHKAVHITTHGFDGPRIAHVREGHQTARTVHYLNHLAPVHEPEVLVVVITAHN